MAATYTLPGYRLRCYWDHFGRTTFWAPEDRWLFFRGCHDRVPPGVIAAKSYFRLLRTFRWAIPSLDVGSFKVLEQRYSHCPFFEAWALQLRRQSGLPQPR